MSWIQLGNVGKAVGLQGAFQVACRNGPVEGLLSNVTLVVGKSPDAGTPFRVVGIRPRGKGSVVSLEGVESRESLERYKGQELWLKRCELNVNDKDEYLWYDLVGKFVRCREGQILGEITEVNNYGASDIITVRGEKGFLDLAFVTEYFDMGFSPKTDIFLKVDESLFADLWF